MYRYFLIYSVLLNNVWSEPFFRLTDKPVFFCFKVCPLYCSQRRSDEDAGSLIYEDHPYFISHDVWVEDDPIFTPYPYHHAPCFCPPKTTTTTAAPTTTTMATTTEEPSFICMVCKKKCDYPKS
ncbi:hypothetical protein PYW08_004941 [Mythimna loreyi]|uniref:Uncharacterized protein n=1 Tax=Mythimna loreyi TaxID=667449 RepID=A0ACC2QDR2_9NEOP|nr:hypothetical protein PYW08_004941 [Mythimna loreyi]